MTFKERLQDGETLVGSWLQSCSPIVAETMAPDFSWLCVDVEHSPASERDVLQMFQAIRSGNPECAPFVRIGPHDRPQRYLDAGAVGIIRSTVNTPDEAKQLVQDCYYPPVGRRGVGFCRANGYGRAIDEYTWRANSEIVVVAQIEHKDALPYLDKILGTVGIDAAFIGPYDLAMSMGHPEERTHPDCVAAAKGILNYSAAPGIHVVDPSAEELGWARSAGYRLIAHGMDLTMLRQ